MERYNIEQINELYARLGICIDDQNEEGSSFWSQNVDSAQFGIYTEDGFNYTNNTNFTSKTCK